ncbi:MAG TPA: hypothetical protein VI916_15410 [Acidimicrobiia bacterium]|nr:hypothetical protein [Acidimicrobiia bacterium]
MRKFLIGLLAAGLLFAGAGIARADKPANPGEKGHCTAYFNGQKKGHDKQPTQPGPFQDLQDRAPDGSDDDDGDGEPTGEGEVSGELSDLFDYCQGTYGIGGNAAQNGRFVTCYTDDDENTDTHNCDDAADD